MLHDWYISDARFVPYTLVTSWVAATTNVGDCLAGIGIIPNVEVVGNMAKTKTTRNNLLMSFSLIFVLNKLSSACKPFEQWHIMAVLVIWSYTW